MPELTNKKNTTFLKKYRNRFVPKFRTFMILQNIIEAIVQHNGFLWKIIFRLTTRGVEQEKEVDTLTIEDDQSYKESSGIPSPQGNVSPIHDTTPDTPILQKIRDYPKERDTQVQVVDEKKNLRSQGTIKGEAR